MQGVQFDLCVYAFVLDSIKYEMSKKDVSWTAKNLSETSINLFILPERY